MRRLFSFVLLAIVASTWPAAAGTLERVRDSGEFKIGYREDAAPFSYKNTLGEAAGYSVELCRMVAVNVKQTLGLADLNVSYVAVTAQNRFEAVRDGRVDILCGPTSVTLSRREIVDFSFFTFVDGASVLYLADGPRTFEELAGRKVGVRQGTTTEAALETALQKMSLNAEVIGVADHGDGLGKLEAGEISAYFADQAILLYLAAGSGAPDKLRLSDRHFTNEPYALALQRGDDDFRLLVDRTLVSVYRSGTIGLFDLDQGLSLVPFLGRGTRQIVFHPSSIFPHQMGRRQITTCRSVRPLPPSRERRNKIRYLSLRPLPP